MQPFDFALIAAGYLFGSISAAILVSRAMGLPDPRSGGSKNPGATNVLRLGGKKAAALTLAGDLLKGLLPVLAARLVTSDPVVLAAVAAGAFLGHLYPVFFGFRGGKGVATAAGVLLGLNWQVGLAALVTWLLMAKLFRISSLSALTAAVLTPFYFWALDPRPAYLTIAIVISLLLIWRHRSNIRELVAGTENRIGSRD